MQSTVFLFATAALVLTAGWAAAQAPMPLPRPAALTPGKQAVPLPTARPSATPAARGAAPTAPLAIRPGDAPKQEGNATHCTDLLAGDVAVLELTASVSGTAGNAFCGDETPVRMTGVKLRGGGTVELKPAVIARCEMALEFARWVRDEVATAATPHDGTLQRIEIAASYSCRPRNNVAGAKLSEHGLANAIDVGAIVVSRGGRIAISDPWRPAILFSEMRRTACMRFTTVLGPGSDAAHTHHLHVDLARRRGGYRICQWDQADDPMP